jgi:hypothetical protein
MNPNAYFVPINQQIFNSNALGMTQLYPCPTRNYPYQFIEATAIPNLQTIDYGLYSGLVTNQQEFNSDWNEIIPDQSPDPTLPSLLPMIGIVPQAPETTTLEPVINWNTTEAFFINLGLVSSSCEKIVFVGMTTDCLNIYITLSKFTYLSNCYPINEVPFFIFIFPKTNLPIIVKWTNDPTGDGISNQTKIQEGLNPLEPYITPSPSP